MAEITSYKPVFPVKPVIGIATLTNTAAVTSRANITGITGLTALTPISTVGKRIDGITIQAKATMAAGSLCIWIYNGTTSYLFYEALIPVDTASNTDIGYNIYIPFAYLVLPNTYRLYISSTINQDMNVFAHGGDYT